MYSVYFFILCSFLQAGNDGTVPRVPERLRAVTPMPFTVPATVQTAPIAPPTDIPTAVPPMSSPTADPKKLLFRNGMLMLPERNNVTLSAPERAVIMSLRTEQRDANGNILQDATGQPIMIPLREGMYVFKGQELGNFDDRELRSMLKINQAQLEVALAEQKKQTEIIYAAQSLRLAIVEHKILIDTNNRLKNTVAEIEVKRAELAVEQARANLELQKYNLEVVKAKEVTVRKNELERTEVQIEQRKLLAPIDGMIVQINAAEGELVREGDPVLEMVQLDTLWVSVKVDMRKYDARDLDGKQATIAVVLANGKTETFPGSVVFCRPKVEAGDTFEVLIEVQNRRVGNYWLLQHGRGDVDIEISL